MTIPILLGTGGHAAAESQQWLSTNNYYSNVGLGRSGMMDTSFTTEAYVSQIIRVPGTISYLSWNLSQNFPNALTLTLNKNSSASDLVVHIDADTTGWVTNSIDNVSVESGDALTFATRVSADTTDYGGTFYPVSARFDADTDSAQMIAAVGPAQIYPTTSLQFLNFLGIASTPSQSESDTQFNCMTAGTWQNMACHLESNGFDRGTTVHNRIGGSNGSMAISIPASTSGYFEDTADSDTVGAGDRLDYGVISASAPGSGSLMMDWIGAHFIASTASYCMIGGSAASPEGIIVQYYSSLFGGGNPFGESARSTGLFSYDLQASNYTNFVTYADMGEGSATFTLLKNGSATTLSVNSDGETGYIIAGTGSVDFAAGDTCTNEMAVTSGEVIWASAALLLEAT